MAGMGGPESTSSSSSERGAHVPLVFLSYSRQDFYLAEQVQTLLVRRGVQVWMDLAELAPGDDWVQRIEQAITRVDGVILLATRASVVSQYVLSECKQAVIRGTPVYVLLGQACTPPASVRAVACYDARSRLSATVAALAQDLTATGGRARMPTRRLPRIWLPTALVLATMALTMLTCAANGLGFLLAALTPLAKTTRTTTLSVPAVNTREYFILLGVEFIAATGVSAACAAALARRRWQFRFVGPLAAVLAWLGGDGLFQLPRTGANVFRYGGTGSVALSSAMRVLGPASVAVSLIGVPMLVVLALSLAVLRSSRTGAGSALARFRVALSANPDGSTASCVIEIPELLQAANLHSLFAEADHKLTFRIEPTQPIASLRPPLIRLAETRGCLGPMIRLTANYSC